MTDTDTGVLIGGPPDGFVVVVPAGQTWVDVNEQATIDPDTKEVAYVTVRYSASIVRGEPERDGMARLRLLRPVETIAPPQPVDTRDQTALDPEV